MQDAGLMFDIDADLSSASYGSGAAGTYICTNGSYDTAAAGSPAAVGPGGAIGGPLLHDFGRGRRMKFYAQITTAVTSAGAATLEVDFISSTTEVLTGSTTVLLATAAIAKTALVAGYRFRHGSTPGVIAQRYIGAQYVIGTATITAGKITSGLQLDVDDHADVLG